MWPKAKVDELQQAEMTPIVLYLFDYVTQGISNDIKHDYVLLDEVELNFED